MWGASRHRPSRRWRSPTGPFRRGGTILRQGGGVFSPGGGDVPVSGPHAGTFLVYHGRSGSYAAVRTLRVAPLRWRRGRPDVPVIAHALGPHPAG
jgi:hypothetical protein